MWNCLMAIDKERKDKLLKLVDVPVTKDEDVQSESLNKFEDEIAKTTPYGNGVVEWNQVEELGGGLLENGCKNLKLIGYFGEALFRRYGLDGLELGCLIFKGIIENNWENVLPKLEDEYKREEECEKNILKIAERWAKVPFLSLALENGDLEGHQRSIEAIESLDNALKSKFSKITPPNFVSLAKVLKEKMSSIISGVGETLTAADEQSNVCIEGAKISEKTAVTVLSVRPKNRDEAFEMLKAVAQYFANNEPHSPLACWLERAIRWRKMGFPELISELLKDDPAACQKLFKVTGVPEES